MPHLTIQYSANVEDSLDVGDFCREMHRAMLSTDAFPLAGMRVRAFRADYSELGDQLSQNGFIDMVLRIGEGRSAEKKQQVGELVFQSAEAFCEQVLNAPHFALSLEIVEINKAYSWKKNSMHPRLVAKSG